MNTKRMFFWDLELSVNRSEYHLKLQDYRLKQLYKDGVIVIMIHCKTIRSMWSKRVITTIELKNSVDEGECRLLDLGLEDDFVRMVDYFYKPSDKVEFNRIIHYPCSTLLAHKFAGDVQLPRLSFDKPSEAEHFLVELNNATRQFIEANQNVINLSDF